MTRIVGGIAGGRRLAVPPGETTRPTSDRAREGLFSTLAALIDLDGARVLDLYAGSGALGLEALSRGAAHALLVERDRRAAEILRANIASLALDGAIAVIGPVERVVSTGPAGVEAAAPPYDVVFADPPYGLRDDEVRGVLTDLHRHGWLAPGALVVLERSARERPWQWPTPLEPNRERRYGQAMLWYGRAP